MGDVNFQVKDLKNDIEINPDWGYFPLRLTKGEALKRGKKDDAQLRPRMHITSVTFTPVGFLTYMRTGMLMQVGLGPDERGFWRLHGMLMKRCEAITPTGSPGDLLFTVEIDPVPMGR